MRIAFLSDNYMENRAVIDPFRAELIREFASRADHFLYVQTNDYLSVEGEPFSRKYEERLAQKISAFKPDILFSLNRAGLTPLITEQISCPVTSWFIDNPNRFGLKLRTFLHSESVFCATDYQIEWLKKNSSLKASQIHYAPFCTRPDLFESGSAKTRDCDVSFVGTLWDPVPFSALVNNFCLNPSNKIWLDEALQRYLQDYDYDFAGEMIEKLAPTSLDVVTIKNMIDDFISSQRRLEILGRLADLKLEVYGTKLWPGLSLINSTNLFHRIQPERIETPQELAKLYRRSKVGLSIAHQQAQSGMPIRVFDILASGAVLISDRHNELARLFKEGEMYLGYDSPDEARENVLRVVKDEEFAKTLRSRAQDEVRAKHSFQARATQFLKGKASGKPAIVEFVTESLDNQFLKSDSKFATVSFLESSLIGASRRKSSQTGDYRVLRSVKAMNQFGRTIERLMRFVFLSAKLAFAPSLKYAVGGRRKALVFEVTKNLALQLDKLLADANKQIEPFTVRGPKDNQS